MLPYSYMPTPYQNSYRINEDRVKFYYFNKEEDNRKVKEAIFWLFQIDLEGFHKLQYIIHKNCGTSLLEINQLPYYEFQMLIDNYKEDIENENKRREEEEKQQKSMYNPNQMMKDQQNSMSKNMPKFEVPKLNMPNFKL